VQRNQYATKKALGTRCEITQKAAWKMGTGSTIKTSICTEYEKLLKGSQAALKKWE
jgi:hypothetical protein